MTVELLTPIFENGIRNVNYFHGRLLSARDLREQQEADRLHRRHLGRAIGAGVVEGLQVTVAATGSGDDPPALQIEPGLAINAKGHSLELAQSEQVELARTVTVEFDNACVFKDCAPPETTQIPTGVGLYILIMSPASGYAESAPKSGLDTGGKVVGCGSRYAVEGVQFRLEQLKPTELSGISDTTRLLIHDLLASSTTADASKLRNLIAHLIYGTEELPGFFVDPLPPASGSSPLAEYGALDELRAAGKLTDCDVPLALLYWTLDGIQFLDLWSVRRRPYEISPSVAWPTLVSERLAAEAEAMFLQFQAHLKDEIKKHANPRTMVAKDYFRYLPAVAFAPVYMGPGSRGIVLSRFLSGKTYHGPTIIEGARLRGLVSQSYDYPPADLVALSMLWVYFIREIGWWQSSEQSRVAVITSGYLPFHGPAQFDVSHWGYSTYTSDLL